MTAGLVASSCTKDRLHKKWLKTRSILVETKYKSYGKLFKQVANAAEASYRKCQFDTHINTVKQLWTNLNKVFSFQKGKCKTVISNLKLDNKTVTSPKDICNGLNDYCSIGQKLVDTLFHKKNIRFDYLLYLS